MKRLFTAFLCFVFLMTMSFDGSAVEKKQKKEPTKKIEQKKPAKPKPAPKPPAKPAPKPPKKDVTKKKYDNFIDKNKNGIDDRRENLKKKTVKPVSNTKPKKKSTTKKNQ